MTIKKKESDILARLAVIEEQIRSGFNGIHERQNTTNGRIGKNESIIQELQRADIRLSNQVSNHEQRSSERKLGFESREVDMEKRIRRLEIIFYGGVGIVVALEFYARVLKDLI